MAKKTWLALLVAVCALFIFGAKANAWTVFRSGNNANVAASETIDSRLWTGARNVDVAGTVNGDVFCAAQTANISGTVNGDVTCAAQTINITGNIEGSVRLVAQTVNISGKISRSATIAAQTINTDPKSVINIDASFAGSDMNLSGAIGRDLAAAASTISFGGSVGRDLTARVAQLDLNNGSRVGGGIDYTSQNQLTKSGSAQVGGKITQHQPPASKSHAASTLFFGGFVIYLYIAAIVAVLVLTALFPRLIHRVSEQGKVRPWMSLLTGFVASLVFPIIFILLLITVIGIPLAILLLLAWLLIEFTSGLFSAYLLGRWVWGTQRNPLLIVLAGTLILLIVYLIPVVGIIALVLVTWMGEGMILRELFTHTPRPSYKIK